MLHIRSLLLGAATAALLAGASYAKDDITVALQLEPPHLDPTSPPQPARSTAVLYSNVFEGLTRFHGRRMPWWAGLAESWEISA